MKFLVDAQLSIRLARFLKSEGFDTVHTQELPRQNATSDADINEVSIREQRVVITKDADFVQSFVLQDKPYKLLLVSTGNIRNSELENLFAQHLSRLVQLLENHRFVEIGLDSIVVHR